MNILQLCKKFPFPLREGEAIAVHYLSRGLAEAGCTVDLLTMNTSKHPYEGHDWPTDFAHYRSVAAVEVDNRVTWWGALENLFSRESYHVSRFVSPDFEQVLRQHLAQQSYEVILLETLYLAPYIPLLRRHSSAKIILRSHNVEHRIWERITAHTRSALKRQYLRHLTNKLRRYEIQQVGQCDLLVPVSSYDLEVFQAMGYRGYQHVAPIGLDAAAYPCEPFPPALPLRLGFIGALDWLPNQEAIHWFLSKVWPLLHRRFPTLQLELAGRNAPPDFLKNLPAGVRFLGEVPSASAFMAGHHVAVVPLQSGSGLKVKVLEAMAAGRVVLGTRVALEGIPALTGRDCLLANTPEEFVQQVDHLLENPQLAAQIGTAARQLIASTFDYRVIARQLLASMARIA